MSNRSKENKGRNLSKEKTYNYKDLLRFSSVPLEVFICWKSSVLIINPEPFFSEAWQMVCFKNSCSSSYCWTWRRGWLRLFLSIVFIPIVVLRVFSPVVWVFNLSIKGVQGGTNLTLWSYHQEKKELIGYGVEHQPYHTFDLSLKDRNNDLVGELILTRGLKLIQVTAAEVWPQGFWFHLGGSSLDCCAQFSVLIATGVGWGK